MKNLVALIVLSIGLQSLAAQQVVMLEQCYALALQNFPLAKQKELLQQSLDMEIKKLNTQYMPQLALNVQATYQSDVPGYTVDNPLFEIPTVPKDQYKGTVDLNQMIYDGGATKHQKEIQSATTTAQSQNVEVQLYQLKAQVSALFFNVLLSNAQLEINTLLRSNIESQSEKVEAAVNNGIMIASNADVLKAELIKTEQQREIIKQNRQASISMLAELIGLALDTNSVFQLPQTDFGFAADFSERPEYKLFQLQQQTLDLQYKSIISSQLPRFSAFAQGGFGRPGLNVLDPDLQPLYIAGLKLSWSPWHWNTEKFQRQIVTINSFMIDTQREVFDKNNRIALLRQSATIQSLQQQIISDKDIIMLRQDITASAAAQLENGVITSTDYITELNAEQQARLSLKTHEIQLEQAKAEYLLITGK